MDGSAAPILHLHLEDLECQHRRLLELLEDVRRAANVRDAHKVEYCLEMFLQYIEIHFSDEEQFMKACGYPELERHVQIHRDFIGALTCRTSDYIADPLRLDSSTVQQLRDWLVTHVEAEDRLYVEYLRQLPPMVCQHGTGRET